MGGDLAARPRATLLLLIVTSHGRCLRHDFFTTVYNNSSRRWGGDHCDELFSPLAKGLLSGLLAMGQAHHQPFHPAESWGRFLVDSAIA